MDTTREFWRVPEFHPCSKPQKWKALQGVDFQKFVSFTGEFWCPRNIHRECESNVMCPMGSSKFKCSPVKLHGLGQGAQLVGRAIATWCRIS